MRGSAGTRFCRTLTAAGVLLLAGPRAAETALAAALTADSAEPYLAAASATAGEDLRGVLSLCDGGTGAAAASGAPAEPAKVFDNLYFLGSPAATAWVLSTSGGLIVIDALESAQDAQTYIETGLRKLKLDPARIKYVIVTHAHADRFGGAQYLAEKYRAALVMSARNWDALVAQAPAHGQAPKRGREATDGEKITLGDTTIELYLSPSQTPGTVSVILPLKDGELMHVGAEWGGAAFDFAPTVDNFTAYIASAQKFSRIAQDRGADVPLSNRSVFDEAVQKIQALRQRASDDPHPFVKGPGSEEKFLAVAAECAMAARARLRGATP